MNRQEFLEELKKLGSISENTYNELIADNGKISNSIYLWYAGQITNLNWTNEERLDKVREISKTWYDSPALNKEGYNEGAENVVRSLFEIGYLTAIQHIKLDQVRILGVTNDNTTETTSA